jgi:hypothetical protein
LHTMGGRVAHLHTCKLVMPGAKHLHFCILWGRACNLHT